MAQHGSTVLSEKAARRPRRALVLFVSNAKANPGDLDDIDAGWEAEDEGEADDIDAGWDTAGAPPDSDPRAVAMTAEERADRAAARKERQRVKAAEKAERRKARASAATTKQKKRKPVARRSQQAREPTARQVGPDRTEEREPSDAPTWDSPPPVRRLASRSLLVAAVVALIACCVGVFLWKH
jgi:hypothetical protein